MGLLTLALLLDLIVGDPDWLWKRLSHPVVLIGRLIDFVDAKRTVWRLESLGTVQGMQSGFVAGALLVLILLLASLAASFVIYRIYALTSIGGFVVELLIVAVLIAQNSLRTHVVDVATGLREGGVTGGRKAVSQIVGRDVSQLSESGVSKAAIESLAENFSDGVVAPAHWYALLGLPGILFYKAVNTADSMVGHRNAEYENFGKCAAIVDDWMNWPAARLASMLTAFAVAISRGGKMARMVWDVTVRDAPGHRSPNAGWPEASFAAALGLSLGGPRRYGDQEVEAVTLYPEGRNDAQIGDIDRALSLFLRCCLGLLGLCGLIWFVPF